MANPPLVSSRPAGLKGRLILVAAVFVIALMVQAIVVWTMYARAETSLERTFSAKLASAAGAAASAMSGSAQSALGPAELSAVLWRIRESHRLDTIGILDADNRVRVSAGEIETGTQLSAFDATPEVVRRVYRSSEPEAETVSLLGDRYRRTYYPVLRDGRVWGVLCLSAYDPVPGELTALRGALWAALGAGLAMAVVIGAVLAIVVHRMNRARDELLRNERLASAGTLAASIAHDIKTPLGTILSSVQLLQHAKELSLEDRELLASVEEEVRRSSDQIDAFLDLARDIPLKLAGEDVHDIVQGTVRLFGAASREKHVAVNTRLPPGPVHATVDRRRLRRALANVILNALEATAGTASPEVTVELGAVRPDGRLAITVSDNGPGMATEIRERAVEPFFTTKQDGTGLGLAVTRQIVEQHGGRLVIAAQEDGGTRVTLEIPVQEG